MTTRFLSSLRTMALLTVFGTLAFAGPGGSGYPHLFGGPGSSVPYLTGPGNSVPYLRADGPGLGGGYLHLLGGPGSNVPYLAGPVNTGGYGQLLGGPGSDGYGKPTL